MRYQPRTLLVTRSSPDSETRQGRVPSRQIALVRAGRLGWVAARSCKKKGSVRVAACSCKLACWWADSVAEIRLQRRQTTGSLTQASRLPSMAPGITAPWVFLRSGARVFVETQELSGGTQRGHIPNKKGKPLKPHPPGEGRRYHTLKCLGYAANCETATRRILEILGLIE
jgi:hypothetical protein